MSAGGSDSASSENDRGAGPATSAPPAHSAIESDEPLGESDAAEFEIETEFRRKLAGLRVLPRRERAQARRAAKEWRRLALKTLLENRSRDRYAHYLQRRQMQGPILRP
jgi:hypothetical protein